MIFHPGRDLLKHDSICNACTTPKPALLQMPGSPNQFVAFLKNLFNTSDWPARWHCGTWSDFHGWLYILSDVFIWAAYFTIPFFLLKLIIERKDVPFLKIFWLFISFILLCGLTHLIDAVIFWWPAYRLSALLRFLTAAVSVSTVFALYKVFPVLLSLKTAKELEDERELRRKAEKISVINLQEMTELEVVNKELESFSYSVSHDLRAPLRAINGFTKILKDDFDEQFDDDAKSQLGMVIENSKKMGELIDNLLEFSHVGKESLSMFPVNMEQLVNTVISELKQLEPERIFTINIKHLENINGDKNMLKQVFTNIISNAFKYTGKTKEAIIEIGSYRENNECVFYVKDNGAGFDMQYYDKLFGVFQRLHSSNEFDGTGVGLAIIKKIITKHCGRVWAEGKVNEGACFYISLPVLSDHNTEN